ncbi:MAG: prepilin-type N-terminal cleavage/methylation domain-containing protein [Patescibacteria group bacterium]|nr:prepilin-type N-terminal cleavage/methylation domain-containing protein [Patescibacteria group bacterium]
MRIKLQQHNRGFTLIELLVYAALLVLIVAAVTTLLFGVLKSHVKARAVRDVIHNTILATDAVSLEIKEATSVYDSTTSSSQLSLETTKNLPVGETSTYVDFFICESRLCIKRESQSPIALTSDSVEIRSLVFQKVVTGSIPSIVMNLRIGSVNPENRSDLEAEIETTSVISFRAY